MAEQSQTSVSQGDVPGISVLMPCRNGMPWLTWAVDDLARCTGCRLEVLVCDDGSTDNSADWLKSLEDAIAVQRAAVGEGGSCSSSTDTHQLSRKGAADDDPINLHGQGRCQALPTSQDFVREEGWPGEDVEEEPPKPAEVAERMLLGGHRFRLLFSGGKGQGAAQNAALFAATEELVSLMDADDRCMHDRFKRLHAAFQEKRAQGWTAVHSGVKIFGTVSKGMAGFVDWQNSVVDPEESRVNRFVEIPSLHQSGLFPRWLLQDKLRGYRDLPGWPIDMDTTMRLGEYSDIRIGKIPDQLYGWRQHVLQSTRNHGRCSSEHLRLCKAQFLLRLLPAEVDTLEVWSVGRTLDVWRDALTEVAALKNLGGFLDEEEHNGRAQCRKSFADGGCPLCIRTVMWQGTKRRRGRRAADALKEGLAASDVMQNGEGNAEASNNSGEEPHHDAQQKPTPSFLTLEHVEVEDLTPAPAEDRKVARLFVFGSQAIREKARQIVCGQNGKAPSASRWGVLDFPAA
mmetsp:Transcript_21073/g.45654  ORF Transcript_21073/g.45654 Transcript_21073/m.45654 type:complete len:514 (-) Transcript_21073:12-1553(-)